jgi:hypothetical protein
MTDAKSLREERDTILRSLDLDAYAAFLRKYAPDLARERLVDPSVPLAAMHKARLHISHFTEEEKRVSRQWLLENGYSATMKP